MANQLRAAIHERNFHPTAVTDKTTRAERLEKLLDQNIDRPGKKFKRHSETDCSYLDKRSFLIDCTGFLDKTIIFTVQNMIPVSKITL